MTSTSRRHSENPLLSPTLATRWWAGVARFKTWEGALVLLPLINFHLLVETRRKEIVKRKRQRTTKKPRPTYAEDSVGAEFAKILVEIEKALRLSPDRTPLPAWAGRSEFALEEEKRLETQIAAVEAQIAELRTTAVALQTRFDAAGNLRGLLYETGRALEEAVLEALRLLGFSAESYKEADSEFDVVFVSPEGDRLIGEAEGKNDKPVAIEKLDQLERNIREDFEKRADSSYAKGVLFGNASRLTPLEERGDFFTSKCIAGAKRSGTALVRTSDLFPIAKYLKEHRDSGFAQMCRAALLETSGAVVVFPPLPKASSSPGG